MRDTLDAIRYTLAESDNEYGDRSVASYELARLELSYVLSAAKRLIWNEIKVSVDLLSFKYCGREQLLGLEISEFSPKIIHPISLENKKAYVVFNRKHESNIQNGFSKVQASPFNYNYVISPKYEFLYFDVPADPKDTILKRSVKDGRVVHPAIAVKSEFNVFCAGEFSLLYNASNNVYFLVVNNCSGHYRPTHLSPAMLYGLLCRCGLGIEKIPTLVFTNMGWSHNTALTGAMD